MIDRSERANARHRAADELCALLDIIGAKERELRVLQAQQVAAVARFTQGRRDFDFELYGMWDSTSRRLAAMELADAKRCGIDTAERLMGDCLRLLEGHPAVLRAFSAGDLSLQAARAAVGETLHLDSHLVPLADEILAGDLVDVLPGQARVVARTRVLELDPDAADRAASDAPTGSCRSAKESESAWPLCPVRCRPSRRPLAGTPSIVMPERCTPTVTLGR